jgi:hypothetical protein
MEPNKLDDFFKKRLEGHSELPEGVIFDKKRVFSSLNQRIDDKKSTKFSWKYAVVILLFLSSAYWHWQQSGMIKEQEQLLALQNEQVEDEQHNLTILLAEQQLIIDSLQNKKIVVNKSYELTALQSLPAIVTTHKLVVAQTATIAIHEPIYITDTKIPNQKSSVPELDLPVYYESERLANNTIEASEGRSFRRKLTELLNN